MNRSRVLSTIGLMMTLAAAMWWAWHFLGSGKARQGGHGLATTFAKPPGVITKNSTTGEFLSPKALVPTPAESRNPKQILPAVSGMLHPNSGSAGLERVHLALSPDGTTGFADRVHAIRALQGKLTRAEIDALSVYLRTPASSLGNVESEDWLRNGMLDALVQQPDSPYGLASLLVTIYQDPSQDPVMRDYALQHMGPIYQRVSPEDQASLQNALWQATGETDSGIAGTAMLALLAIGETNPGIDQARLAQTALQLVAADSASELTRITAVAVCGRLGVSQALPEVEQLSQQSQSVPLRIAATAALGDYAMNQSGATSAEANRLLTQLAQSSDVREAAAAESTLRRVARASAPLSKQTRS